MNIGIIGAGATGLTAAYYLSKDGHNVTVIEAENYYGGIASAVEIGATRLERFYHHIFTGDNEIIDLVNELGLTGKLKWYSPRNAIFTDNKLYPFTTPFDLATYPAIPLAQRIKLGLLVLKAGRLKDWAKLEDTSAAEWITLKAGAKAYEKLWGPLLESKFDADAADISAVWLWNKLKLRGSSRGKRLGREMLGYMDGSFAILYDELVKRIENTGGSVILNSEVVSLEPEDDGRIRVLTSQSEYIFDKVLATTAPQILDEIAGRYLASEYREMISKISYKANICVVLELSKPLSPFYWVTVAEKNFPFVLLMEHTSLVPIDSYGSNIVYLSRYVDIANPLCSRDVREVADIFIKGVSAIFPSFNPADIKNMHVYRTRYAQPVVVRNYSKVIPPFQTPIRNLYLSCMAQIYPEDRGQNHAVRMGREAALLLDGRPGESRPEFEELPSESCIEFEDRPGESCTKFEECPVEPCAKSGEHLCEQFTNAHAGKEERK